ncbi:hypothetical protein O2W14_14180 [Modestobacter sp. VKM Ac-2986]|uniref:hypothetical protein n=1 Tax=Modestobacter sp. VKM Ac-2986 TaxID=3004140 RepID=UPI0022ABAE78|nr:hypothetical protein [Modestobacter sp. VKM Ac-2986]MCZ2829983.1 hypothetical protein [Modestobacter sp. VKM Ac-2986]
MTDAHAAAAQLAALQADRAAMADRAMQPWWYDVALGLLVFGLLSAVAVGNVFMLLPAVALFGAGLRWLVSAYQRITGFWVDGFRRGSTRKAAYVYLVVYVAFVVPALVLHLAYDRSWPLVAAGAVAGVTAAVTSRWFGALYVRELRGQL